MGSRSHAAESEAAASDGRIQRSRRSREKIVRAMFELVGEGDPTPAARAVASRAGVGIRSVFRHFSDMETLFVEMDAMFQKEARPLLDSEPAEGELSERAAALVRTFCAIFERFAPYARAGQISRRRSPFLQERYAAAIEEQRQRLRRWLPEIDSAPREWADALEAATSFEHWDYLRATGHGKRRARAAVDRAVQALVADLD